MAMSGMMVSGRAVPTAAKHTAHRAFAEIELASEPLDAVHEQLAPGKDHRESDDEEKDGHRPDSIGTGSGAPSLRRRPGTRPRPGIHPPPPRRPGARSSAPTGA